MAKATILSSLGAGLYRVKLHFNNSRIETRLAHMATQIADYTTELAELEPDKAEKTAALNASLAALNNYINSTDPAVYIENPTELNALTKATWTARAALDVITHNEKLVKLKKTTLEKEVELLNKFCPSDFETNAWCVEYVEDLSGETEAIECDYLLWRDVGNNQIEHDTGLWLPAATTTPINALIHPMASSEHATWFNLCMAPAAQRHAGRYRIATISNLNKTLDTCDIDFEGRYDVVRANGNVIDNAPIHPQFSGVQQNHYTGATIDYGTCNAKAFENGDRVIVDLHGGVGTPTVIGFYSNPRACPVPVNWPDIRLTLNQDLSKNFNASGFLVGGVSTVYSAGNWDTECQTTSCGASNSTRLPYTLNTAVAGTVYKLISNLNRSLFDISFFSENAVVADSWSDHIAQIDYGAQNHRLYCQNALIVSQSPSRLDVINTDLTTSLVDCGSGLSKHESFGYSSYRRYADAGLIWQHLDIGNIDTFTVTHISSGQTMEYNYYGFGVNKMIRIYKPAG